MEAFNYYDWIILPLMIFVARVADTSIGTLRIIMISKGRRKIVRLLGFLEVLLWLVAVGQIVKNLNNILCYVAFAGGFSMGSYIGFLLEQKLALGQQIIRIITNKEPSSFLMALNNSNQGYTVIDGQGAKGPVKVIYSIVNRKNIDHMAKMIDTHIPNSFYSLEEITETSQGGVFNGAKRHDIDMSKIIMPLRKKK